MEATRYQAMVDGTAAVRPNRTHHRITMGRHHGTGPAGSRRHRGAVRERLVTGLAALLFLAGGIATYVVPQLTAPFYIVGSGATLIHTVVGALVENRWRRHRTPVGTVAVQVLAITAIVVVGFWLGFRFPPGR